MPMELSCALRQALLALWRLQVEMAAAERLRRMEAED